MDIPGLLSVLLYQDCYTQAVAEEQRLRALALGNGTNAALQLYLNYINKTKQSPSPEQLKSLALSTLRGGGIELIEGDLEEASDFKAMYPDLPPENERRSGWMPYLSLGLAVLGLASFGAYYFRGKLFGRR